MANWNEKIKLVLDELILSNSHVRLGKMFGYPAYYAGKKLCICLYEEGVSIKLPEQSASALLTSDNNTVPFQPMGKPKMREWVQINLENAEDYKKYQAVFEASIRYLTQQGMVK